MKTPIYDSYTSDRLNVAAICPGTRAMGPGLRSALWVQGCPFNCQGCISPEWRTYEEHRLMTPEQAVSRLLSVPDITGITFSGGEPILQAAALAETTRLARQADPRLTVICYTGYTLQQLVRLKNLPGIKELMGQLDVLIDGQYDWRRHTERGMRGSSNQSIYYLSDRLCDNGLEQLQRRTEFRILDGEMMLVGVPTRQARLAFDSICLPEGVLSHERS